MFIYIYHKTKLTLIFDFRGDQNNSLLVSEVSTSVKASGPSDIDIFDMLREGDILKELNPEKWEKSILDAVKWQQKQAAFDELTKVMLLKVDLYSK